MILVTAGVVLEAVARPGREAGTSSGRRGRGWREVGRKEVRKVEEMRVWREGEEVRRSWREGCGEGFDWWVGGGRKVDRILRKSGDERKGGLVVLRRTLFERNWWKSRIELVRAR